MVFEFNPLLMSDRFNQTSLAVAELVGWDICRIQRERVNGPGASDLRVTSNVLMSEQPCDRWATLLPNARAE